MPYSRDTKSPSKPLSSLTIKDSKAYKYALFAAQSDNPKIGRYVRYQAQKWLEIVDGHNKNAYIDEKKYIKICKLLSIIIHPDLNKPMLDALEDYSLLFIFALFCTRNKDGTPYYTTGLLEIARKNYKTFTAAVIFIIALLISPRFSRLFSVAPDLKLSSELKVAVRKIIKSSPALEKHFKVMRSEVRCLLTDTEYTPLAYSKDKLDGKLAHVFLADEVGAMDSYPVEAMRSSQINLTEKMGILISTQYPNDSNGLTDEIDIAKKQLDGTYTSGKKTFALLYEPDIEIIPNWETDDNVLYQSNPVALSSANLFDELKNSRTLAILYENKRENFLCKHCNIQYKGVGAEGYIDLIAVQSCSRQIDIDWWRGRSVFLGLDLSQTEDNTAVAMVTYDEETDTVYSKVWCFLPENRVDLKSNKENVQYKQHIAAGEAFACGDDIIGYDFVERFILDITDKYGVNVVQLGFDRFNAISTVQKLESDEKHPIECVEIKQHSSVLHPATKWLKELVLQKKFVYDENKLLEINFSNARCTEDTNLNKYVNKKRSAGKVDMVVALINSMYLLQQEILNGAGDFVVQY